MATFTIWEGDGCGIALGRGTERPLVDPGAKSVATFEADSRPAACQVLNDRYGWGEYRDDGAWEPVDGGEADGDDGDG